MSPEQDELNDEIVEAVNRLSELFSARSVRHALIGGLAASIRGRSRLTEDVDILLDVPQRSLPGLL